MKSWLTGWLVALALPVLAAGAASGTPTVPGALAAGQAAEREMLFRDLASARTQAEGRAVEDEIWRFWFRLAPDLVSAKLLDKAVQRREAHDLDAAEALLDDAVALAPGFAEAWNQRAFVRHLRDNDSGAEDDLLHALELEPRHFGALAGLFLVLARQGRMEAANAALAKAVRIHPWLKERAMLPRDPDAGRPPSRGS